MVEEIASRKGKSVTEKNILQSHVGAGGRGRAEGLSSCPHLLDADGQAAFL